MKDKRIRTEEARSFLMDEENRILYPNIYEMIRRHGAMRDQYLIKKPRDIDEDEDFINFCKSLK